MAQKRLFISYLKPLLCLLSGIGITFCGIFLSAFLMVSRNLSQAFLTPLATFSVCVGCCGGAWLTARIRGQNGLLCGVFTGAFYTALLLLWSWHNGLYTPEGTALFRFALVFVSGSFGGYLGMLAAEKKRRHR